MDNQSINNYKIIKRKCKKICYSLKYGHEEWEKESLVEFAVRFEWNKEIHEYKTTANRLNLNEGVIEFEKKFPGVSNPTEYFGFELLALENTDKGGDDTFNNNSQEISKAFPKHNILYEEENYQFTLFAQGKEYCQQFTIYRITCLNTDNFQMVNLVLNSDYNLIEMVKNKFDLSERVGCNRTVVNKNSKYFICKAALSKILQLVTSLFYASNVNNENGYFSYSDLGKKMFPNYLSLVSLCPPNLMYDSEGNKICEKMLIKSGIINDYLTNSKYSYVVPGILSGNASLIESNRIEAYQIKLITNKIEVQDKILDRIIDFEEISLLHGRIKGTAISVSQALIHVNFEMTIGDFFNKISYVSDEFELVDKCWVTDAVLEL